LKLSGIIWLEEIVEKIERKHHVTQEEVREVLRGHRVLDSLRRDTDAVKTFILHWGKPAVAAISLYSLYVRKHSKRCRYRRGT
jgi:hypothetical protein